MKFKRSAVVLTAIMMMCASGCANSEKNENADKADKIEKSNSSAVTTTVANTVTMPEPIPVPEGGWTDETIKDVIYINGKKLEFPCTIDDLGDGFEIEPNEEADKEMKEDGSAVYHLNYCGNFVGFVGMRESDKIYLLDFDAFDSPIENYPDIPFSVNGVTIGTPISEVREIMGKDFSDEKDNGHFNCDFKNFRVSMYDAYNNDKISSIEIFSH
ncbi:MAG: hypothetical protein K6F71_01355 [Ruminococcus sp.]|uniref:hypothetical protein n=1 Tax=Ruminococcus sp. TaxID=41978 RepID=UPI0025EAE42B|nr:hypothetical protein [Ruminococcus sp.]MCR5539472.1 hypothetical protein [Ruminococcus sp.]